MSKIRPAATVFLVFMIQLALCGVVKATDFVVKGTIPALQQPDTMACWATAATMVYDWKQQNQTSIAAVVSLAGQHYVDILNNNSGLSGSDKPAFLTALGLKSEGPQTYTVSGLVGLLQQYGPLWVTTNEAPAGMVSLHGRVLYGILAIESSDPTMMIMDPASGGSETEAFSTFTSKYESVAQAEGDAYVAILGFSPQIVHAQ